MACVDEQGPSAVYILCAASLVDHDWDRLHGFMTAMVLAPVLVDMNDHEARMDLA